MSMSLSHRVPPRRVGVIAVLMSMLIAPSCLVSEHCYEDRDCRRSEICSADGRCVFECAVNQDCEAKFGLEYNCLHGRCEVAPTCSSCRLSHAEYTCVHGDCRLTACLPNYYDRDGQTSNGCEFYCPEGAFDANGNPDDGCECTPTNAGVESCNDVDDDCDGKTDEDFNLFADVANCGSCGNICPSSPQTISSCSSGQCHYNCLPGYFDTDGTASNGCESTACVMSTELCNGRDDDCDCPGDTNGDSVVCGPGDQGVDEDFDKSSVLTCGPVCAVCGFPNASATCVEGACRIADCEVCFWDLNAKDGDGCEYACTPNGAESCNSVDDDCDGLTDEGEVCASSCPTDMVAIGDAYCIDRHEASRADATATSQGVESSRAYSRAGVLPWMVNPMTKAHLAEFDAACAASGKHLCTRDEWFAACTGPKLTAYVYGNRFDREACNCVDTYCNDYCTERGLSSCSTAENCGYSYNCFHEVATGTFAGCTNDYGTFDLNGNVWEVVPSENDSRGYEVRGGAFNCASPSERVNCQFNAGWAALYAGFRCCKAVDSTYP